MANGNGVSVNIKTIATVITIAILLAGIIGNYYVTGYRIEILEKNLDDLETYVEGIDDNSDELAGPIREININIEYIKRAIAILTGDNP